MKKKERMTTPKMGQELNSCFHKANIEFFDYPVIVANDDLFIIDKNKATTEYNIRFRVGASLKNYFSLYDIKRISSMSNGETLFLNSSTPSPQMLLAYRAKNEYFILNATVVSLLKKQLDNVTQSDELINKYFSHVFDNKNNLDKTKTKQREMRFAARMKRHYALFNDLFFFKTTEPLGYSDIVITLSKAIDLLSSIFNQERAIIVCDNRVSRPMFAEFSRHELAVVVSSILLLAFSKSETKRVYCALDSIEDHFILSVGFITNINFDFSKSLFSFDDAISAPECLEIFEFVLLKRICERNNWRLDFSVYNDSSNKSLKLCIPCNQTSNLKFSMDDSDYIKFSNMLIEEMGYLL